MSYFATSTLVTGDVTFARELDWDSKVRAREIVPGTKTRRQPGTMAVTDGLRPKLTPQLYPVDVHLSAGDCAEDEQISLLGFSAIYCRVGIRVVTGCNAQ